MACSVSPPPYLAGCAGCDVNARDKLRRQIITHDRRGDMLLTVFLVLPVMSLLSTFSRSTTRTFTRTVVNRTPAVLSRGEHTLPKLPYAYDVSPGPCLPLWRTIGTG